MRVTEKTPGLILRSGVILCLILQLVDRYIAAFPRWLEITSGVLALIFLIFCIAAEIALRNRRITEKRA
ncbi:MAG: hypothetical protein AAGU32_01835 [Bacillota bacterium]